MEYETQESKSFMRIINNKHMKKSKKLFAEYVISFQV